jgi:hypothetical protein
MYDEQTPTTYKSTGFEPPPGFCQGCGGKSDWRMLKVVHARGESWKARYAHNVLDGGETGSKPDWSKISMKRGLRFEGWLEMCNHCNGQPVRPNKTTITAEDIAAHKGANLESLKRMAAEASENMTALPYNKSKRGAEV